MRIMDNWDQVESAVATPWSGGGIVGARGHNAGHLSFFV